VEEGGDGGKARERREERTLSDPVEDVADSPYSQQVDGPVFPQLLGRQGHDVVHLRLVLSEAAPDGRAEEGVAVDEGSGEGPEVGIYSPLDDAVQGLGAGSEEISIHILINELNQ